MEKPGYQYARVERKVAENAKGHMEGCEYESYVVKTMSGPSHTAARHKGGTEMERPRTQNRGPQVFKGL